MAWLRVCRRKALDDSRLRVGLSFCAIKNAFQVTKTCLLRLKSYASGRREVSFRWARGKLSAAESLPFADGKHSFRTAQGGASLHKTQENPHKALALCGLRMHTREREIYARRINFAVNGRLRASS